MSQNPKQPLKPERAKVSWNVYYAGKVGRWIGTVEATTGQAAIAEGAKQFGYQAKQLLVIKRRLSPSLEG
jgi:hypothetical protein